MRRLQSCACAQIEKNRASNAERFNSPDAAAALSRNGPRDPSTPAAAALDVEAILLVAHNDREKRPKRIGRGPDNDDDEAILGRAMLSSSALLS